MNNSIFDSQAGIISDSDIERPSLQESFRLLAERSGRGWVNATRIQREAVSYIGLRCGDRLTEYLDPSDRRYPINDILEDARRTYTPYVNHTRTIRRWLYYFCRYRKTMADDRQRTFIMTRNYRRSSGSRYRRTRVDRNTKWNNRDRECLIWLLENKKQNFIDEIQSDLLVLTCKKWSRSHIYREIRRNGFSCSKVYIRAAQIDNMERLEYKIRLEEMCPSPEMVVCIDETARVRMNGERDRIWARTGRYMSAVMYRFFGTRKMRYSMLAAADMDGFIIEACSVALRERGDNEKDMTRGTIGKDRFKLWVKESLIPILGIYELNQPRSLVVIDNATIHHDEDIVNMIRDAGAEILYLAPYSPDFNPIEIFFYIYKKSLKRFNHMNWFDAHFLALHSVTPRHGKNSLGDVEFPCVSRSRMVRRRTRRRRTI